MSKKVLNLPKTDFPMRSGLPVLEKSIINFWKENKVREKIKNKRKGAEKKVLHFGPPYSNGDFHMGHGLTYILKAIIARSWNFQGYDIENLTGHDCHGLPIELSTKKNLKTQPKNLKEFLQECNNLANKYVKIHEDDFERMGVLKDEGFYATKDSIPEIYEVFSKLILKNLVYLDQKPCPWSITEKTVISEAEIEYRTKITKTVDIALEITDSPIQNLKGKFICIWTTTPWTLADNVAVSFNKNHNYVFGECGDKILIIGEDVIEDFKTRVSSDFNSLGVISGEIFEGVSCKHPIYDYSVPLLHGDFVEKNSGTGFVHIAPAHGLEDFELCKEHVIELRESVDDSGFYYNSVEKLGGKHIFRDEEFIFDLLEGKLLQVSTIEHEYPFDSRSGNIVIDGQEVFKGTPIVYRATEQLFIDIHAINKEKLKKDLESLPTKPDFLKHSLLTNILNRKEWCVSRNRVLGVPAAVFVNRETREILINNQLQEKIIKQMKKDPLYFFSENSIDILDGVTDGITEGIVNKENYEPKFFVLDVWFDSGCVAYFLSKYFNLPHEFQVADVYAEGKDQVRGWFQSSGLLSYLLEEKLPYKAIVSHGFLVDEQGSKISKSKSGKKVSLSDVMDEIGVEVLYLWVMSSDFSDDVSYGENIINKASEMYRKFRNVMRYLISVVESENITMNITMDKVQDFLKNNESFHYLEKSILRELKVMQGDYVKHLETYSFRKAFDSLFLFVNRISELYFNARKDTLYCDSQDSFERKSTVYCMYILLHNLNIILSSLLAFTSEEIFIYRKKFDRSFDKSFDSITSIHELSISDCFLNDFKEFDDYDIEILTPILEIIRKKIEDFKKVENFNRNSDLNIILSRDFFLSKLSSDKLFSDDHNVLLDILSKISGVLSVKLENDDSLKSDSLRSDSLKSFECKISISSLKNCERCNRRNAIDDIENRNICLRCSQV